MPTPAGTAAYWARLAADWRHSGLTQAEFCRRRAVPLHTFRARLYQRTGTAPAPDRSPDPPAPCFLPVRVVAEADRPDPTPTRPIEVLLDGGRRVAVAPGFDPETLRRVVAALEPPPC